jgi:hypothetical protein
VEIVEYEFHSKAIFEIVNKGFLRGISVVYTKAIRPKEIFTIFFEHREDAPECNFTIKFYRENEKAEGIYLDSLKRRDGSYLHVYYEKKKCLTNLQT